MWHNHLHGTPKLHLISSLALSLENAMPISKLSSNSKISSILKSSSSALVFRKWKSVCAVSIFDILGSVKLKYGLFVQLCHIRTNRESILFFPEKRKSVEREQLFVLLCTYKWADCQPYTYRYKCLLGFFISFCEVWWTRWVSDPRGKPKTKWSSHRAGWRLVFQQYTIMLFIKAFKKKERVKDKVTNWNSPPAGSHQILHGEFGFELGQLFAEPTMADWKLT